MSVSDARVEEAVGAAVAFAVTLSRAASARVTMDYRTQDGSAQVGEDYEAGSDTLTFSRAAREARLPAKAFQALRHGHRPSIDRADELCRALGISMTIGAERQTIEASPANAADES